MIEGTIMVPVFITLWLGVVYLQQLYSARGLARTQARRCAFEHAMAGCGRTPAGCSASPNVTTDEVATAHDIVTHARTGTDDDFDPFQEVPVLDEAFRMLFGTTTGSTVAKHVPFPFNDQRVGIAKGQVALLCNSQPATLLGLAQDILCEELGCSSD
jgi:hypothetical protein